jgi:hypothetical protein
LKQRASRERAAHEADNTLFSKINGAKYVLFRNALSRWRGTGTHELGGAARHSSETTSKMLLF